MKRFLIAMVLAAIAVEPVFAQGLRNNLLNRRNRLQRNALEGSAVIAMQCNIRGFYDNEMDRRFCRRIFGTI